MISRIWSFRFCPLGSKIFRVELTQWLGSFVILSSTGKVFFAAKTSFPFLVLTEHLQAFISSMISPPVFSDRFAVTNFNWNLTGFPWPSMESMISKTSHNRIKVEFMGAIVQWWGWIIKDTIIPKGFTTWEKACRPSDWLPIWINTKSDGSLWEFALYCFVNGLSGFFASNFAIISSLIKFAGQTPLFFFLL